MVNNNNSLNYKLIFHYCELPVRVYFGLFIRFTVTMDNFFADSDTESESYDDDNDLDFVLSCDDSESTTDSDEILRESSDGCTSSNASNHSIRKNGQNHKQNEIEFVSDLSLSPILKTKSNADVEVWKRFGHLMKAGELVKGLSNRYYCSLCFDEKKLKRSVFTCFFFF